MEIPVTLSSRAQWDIRDSRRWFPYMEAEGLQHGSDHWQSESSKSERICLESLEFNPIIEIILMPGDTYYVVV